MTQFKKSIATASSNYADANGGYVCKEKWKRFYNDGKGKNGKAQWDINSSFDGTYIGRELVVAGGSYTVDASELKQLANSGYVNEVMADELLEAIAEDRKQYDADAAAATKKAKKKADADDSEEDDGKGGKRKKT